MKKILFFILSIITSNVYSQYNHELDWEFNLEKISETEYNLIAESIIPDSFSIISAYGDGGWLIPLTLNYDENVCLLKVSDIKEITKPVPSDYINENSGDDSGELVTILKGTIIINQKIIFKPQCNSREIKGFLEYFLVKNERIFYPPMTTDFKMEK